MKFTGKDIICFSSIDWDFLWQGHQEIMTRLAAQGNRVLYIENTALRTIKLQDFSRLKHRFLNWWKSIHGFRQERENLFVYSPLTLPFPYSKIARWINTTVLSAALKNWMTGMNFQNPVIWTYLPTNLICDVISKLNPSLVIYYCVADFEYLSDHPEDILKSEKKLAQISDVIFVQSDLFKKKFLDHPNVHVFPAGVNMDTFHTNVKPVEEISSLKKPVIGYIGGLHKHVDFDLIEHVAKNTEGTVALIGPVQISVGRLENIKNVVFFGHQPQNKMARFIRGFDVGMIPYLITDYTKTVYPTKMNEYLAMGVPVVSTNLPDVEQFNKKNNHVVGIANDKDSFVREIKNSISDNSVKKVQQRISVAKKNHWKIRVEQMSDVMTDAFDDAILKYKNLTNWEKFIHVYKQSRRKILTPVIALFLFYLLIFYTPIIWYFASPLKITHELQNADAIVVFGSGFGEGGNSGRFQERVKQALDIYNSGKAQVIIFSSGYVFAFKEGELMKRLAVALGVPEDNIILEKKGENTYKSVEAVNEMLKRKNWNKIIVVSSPYHMRRALMTWNKLAPDVEVIAAPVPQSQFYERSGKKYISLEQIKGLLHEVFGIVVYWFKGYV